MTRPVRFETLDRFFELPEGTVSEWAKTPEFPLAGEGVAFENSVRDWATQRGFVLAGVVVQPLHEAAATITVAAPLVGDTESEPESSDEIEWVTIRIPVAKQISGHVGAKPCLGLRLHSHDIEARRGFQRVLAGCRLGHVQRVNGRHCDIVSDMVKWLFEEIEKAVHDV